MTTDIGDITRLLNAASGGEDNAAEQLWSIAQQEIRGQAEMLVARERARTDLQPTMLINEAWLRLHGGTSAPEFKNHREFYGAIWRVMRQILVDYARSRQSLKRGGNIRHVPLEFAADELQRLDRIGDDTDALLNALDRLRELDPEGFEVFWGRFALGLSKSQVAAMLDIEVGKVDNHWQHARAWLRTNIAQPE
ncbi:MAG: ECF-type sigma factor [Planctomycetota bacterium]|nr:ECF-type sigma factor [Planctomycetota bacterium]